MKFILVKFFLLVMICNEGFAQTNLGRVTPYSISGDRGSGYVGDLIVSAESAASNVITLINTQGTTVSTDDLAVAQQFKIYPNPSSHKIIIESVEELRFYQVHNSLGQLLYQGREKTVDISELPSGSYYLSINGNSAASFIKQ